MEVLTAEMCRHVLYRERRETQCVFRAVGTRDQKTVFPLYYSNAKAACALYLSIGWPDSSEAITPVAGMRKRITRDMKIAFILSRYTSKGYKC